MPDSFWLLDNFLRERPDVPAGCDLLTFPLLLALWICPLRVVVRDFLILLASPLTSLRLQYCLMLGFALLEKLHLLQSFLCRIGRLVRPSKILSLAGNDSVPTAHPFDDGNFPPPQNCRERTRSSYARTVRTGQGACATTSYAIARSMRVATLVSVSIPRTPRTIKSAPHRFAVARISRPGSPCSTVGSSRHQSSASGGTNFSSRCRASATESSRGFAALPGFGVGST